MRHLPVIISAWATAVLVAGQFAMVAVVPVTIVLVGAFRRLPALRWWAAALGAAYVAGLALWAIGPDRAPSLSKNLHPAHEAVIVVLAVAVAVAYHVMRRQLRRRPEVSRGTSG